MVFAKEVLNEFQNYPGEVQTYPGEHTYTIGNLTRCVEDIAVALLPPTGVDNEYVKAEYYVTCALHVSISKKWHRH